MSSIKGLLDAGLQHLAGSSDTPLLDCQILLADALTRPRSWLYAHPEAVVAAALEQRYRALLYERAQGRPIAHLTGTREFWSLNLKVTAATLIPRPETELLVERILALPLPQEATVLDLGTGSGAIALALATERPGWHITAVDRSAAALAVARENGALLALDRVRWLAGSWFEPLVGEERFDLVVSNPPYVACDDPHLGQGDLRFEPDDALISGRDGLDAIRHLIRTAPNHLRAGGWLWLEHGYDQGVRVKRLLSNRGFADPTTIADLSGQPRVSGGQWLSHTSASD